MENILQPTTCARLIASIMSVVLAPAVTLSPIL